MRYFAGLSVNTSGRRLEGGIIRVHGEGAGAPLEAGQVVSFDLPAEIVQMCSDLHHYQYALETHSTDHGRGVTGVDLLLTQFLARELATLQHEALGELLGDAKLSPQDLLAVGVYDCGMRYEQSFGMGYHSLCDAAYLASLSGHNIIEGFAASDIIHSGDGKSTLAMPTWVLLGSDQRHRLLLDLGHTARITFLPKTTLLRSHERIVARDIAPCGSLLDSLTADLTHGTTTVDGGGREAVQGCLIGELLSCWREAMPSTVCYGIPGAYHEPLGEVLKRHQQNGWSIRDILCTATHGIGTAVADAIADTMTSLRLSEHDKDELEIITMGGCCLHGLLLRQITQIFPGKTLIPISQIGITSDTLGALTTAIATLMFTDQMPSNLPYLSGASISVPQGRITPGSPQHWQRLLQSMARVTPGIRSLRSAI